jgi:hypothetical protein
MRQGAGVVDMGVGYQQKLDVARIKAGRFCGANHAAARARNRVSGPDGSRQSLSREGNATMRDIQGFPAPCEEHDHEKDCRCRSVFCDVAFDRTLRTITFLFSPAR